MINDKDNSVCVLFILFLYYFHTFCSKRGTCFFIDYENSIYLITACHTFLTGSFEEGDYETIRNAVSTAKVIVENREEDIKKHYPERTFFYVSYQIVITLVLIYS